MLYTINQMERDVFKLETLPYDPDNPESILHYLETTPCGIVFSELTPLQARGLAGHPDERVHEAFCSASFQWAQEFGLTSALRAAVKRGLVSYPAEIHKVPATL